MDIQTIIFIVYIIIVVCMALLTWYTVKKGDKQTDSILSLTQSFSSISSDLKVIITKIDDYEKQSEKTIELQKELTISALKNISDRMEKLEKSTNNSITSLDNDINKLYSYCSRKIERDNIKNRGN